MNKTNLQRHQHALFRLAACLIWVMAARAHADDWRQYNGSDSNRTSAETLGRIDWSEAPPAPIWKVPTTNGFSSFTTAGGKVFTLISRDDAYSTTREFCVALDADTGEESWATPLSEADYDFGGETGDGPRSTPSCDGERVYVYDAAMILYCLNAADGSEIWKKDIVADYAGRNITWQNASSPLLEGDLVIVAGGGPGESLLAFHRTDGSLAWKSLNEKMTHATPVAATIHGVRQIIFFLQSGLVAVSPADGSELWRYAYPFQTSTGASPVVCGDYVFCASINHNKGAILCRIIRNGSEWQAVEVWQKIYLVIHWSTPVYHNGHLYGIFSHGGYGDAPLKCIELLTGEEKWAQEDFGQGGLILADNKLIVLSDYGEIAVAEAAPDAYREIARAPVLEGKCWSTPVLSNNRIYARSVEEGICFELSDLSPPPEKTGARWADLDYQ